MHDDGPDVRTAIRAPGGVDEAMFDQAVRGAVFSKPIERIYASSGHMMAIGVSGTTPRFDGPSRDSLPRSPCWHGERLPVSSLREVEGIGGLSADPLAAYFQVFALTQCAEARIGVPGSRPELPVVPGRPDIPAGPPARQPESKW